MMRDHQLVTINDAIKADMDMIDQKCANQGKRISTGLPNLDNVLGGGIKKGELIVLGGRPSSGKTALALKLSLNLAKQKQGVSYHSLEYYKEQMAHRLLIASSGIDYQRLAQKKLGGKGWRQLTQSLKLLSKAPIYIDDSIQPHIVDLINSARKYTKEKNISLIVIDYLHLIKEADSAAGLETIMAHLRCLAIDCNVAVLVLSQLTRAVVLSSGHRQFRLNDLRGSKKIGEIADRAIFIDREGYWQPIVCDIQKMELSVFNKQGKDKPLVANLLFERSTGVILNDPKLS